MKPIYKESNFGACTINMGHNLISSLFQIQFLIIKTGGGEGLETRLGSGSDPWNSSPRYDHTSWKYGMSSDPCINTSTYHGSTNKCIAYKSIPSASWSPPSSSPATGCHGDCYSPVLVQHRQQSLFCVLKLQKFVVSSAGGCLWHPGLAPTQPPPLTGGAGNGGSLHLERSWMSVHLSVL